MTGSPSQDSSPHRVCVQCGAPADPRHRYCGHCGSALHDVCISCGATVAPDLDYCTTCGFPMNPGLRSAMTVHEERRTVSVLFVDLIGFAGVAERLDPEDLHQLQMAYFSTASAAIRGHGGIVEKYIGDAVMAVFGVPVETEHDAHRAVVAALGLQRALDDRPLAGRYRMRARLGVATGEALVDLAAMEQSGEALVSGDVVSTAGRLQQHAPAGGVLVSAATKRATHGTIRYADEPVSVVWPGKAEPAVAWRAVEPVERVFAVDDEVIHLVGRAHELDMLTAALQSGVREGEARLVSVVGGHGLGKSRLIRELTRRVAGMPDLGLRWRLGRCLPYGESGTYGALAEIVKAEAAVRDSDDPDTARNRLSESLSRVLPAEIVARLTDLIGPLAGLPGPPVTAGETQAAWRQVLLALAERVPTVLVIEDLHYADPILLRFIADLVGAATGVPLTVLCTMRPELLAEQPSWAMSLPGMLTISLGNLRGAKLNSLITSLLHRQGLPDVLAGRLATITNGNPMYAVEYVHMLAERAATGELDPDAELAIPETVHGVVANRIDLLGPTERTVLHASAVLGEGICSAAIAALVEMSESEVSRILYGLTRRDMLVVGAPGAVGNQVAGVGDTEFSFRHILLRDVAYRRLPRATRVALHRRAADWLDRVAVAGRRDTAAAVARHRVAALTLAQNLGIDSPADVYSARQALTSAAEAAFATYAVVAALGYIEQALNLWPTDDAVDERRDYELLRCRLAFLADGERFYRDGGAKQVAGLIERMRDATDVSGEARAETLLGQVEMMRAERQRAVEHLNRAVRLFSELPDDPAKAEAYGELARLHLVEYETVEALPAARTARMLAERLGLADAAANAWVTHATARYVGGDRGGLDELRAAIGYSREHRLPALRRALANLAVTMQEEGDLAQSSQLQAESVAAQGAAVSLVLGHSEEAELAWFTGDWVSLRRAAEEYFDSEDSATTEWDMQLRGRRACLRLLSGESGEDLERCVDAAEQSGFPRLMFAAYAYGALGQALAGHQATAAQLIGQLAEVWRNAPTAMTMEWLSALVHAAALIAEGHPAVAELAAAVVDGALIDTRWVAAARAVASGAEAHGRGSGVAAVRHFAGAMEAYDSIGSTSDAVLAAAWAARAGGTSYLNRVRAFADRNHSPGLTAVARNE